MPSEKREKFTNREWEAIGAWIRQELWRRESDRSLLEAQWAEIDRQIAMRPVKREKNSGEAPDWFPDLELPLQANALEVIAADARRLKFPRGPEWFRVSAELSQSYVERWDKRRNSTGGGTPIFPEKQAREMVLDQETANVLAKTAIDYFHNLYDFRSQIGLFDAECIKYGTAVARVEEVQLADFSYDFRGQTSENLTGPAVVTLPLRHTYLDDSPSAFMLEGTRPNPSIIRVYSMKLEKLKAAAKKFPEKGWILSQINKLEPTGNQMPQGSTQTFADPITGVRDPVTWSNVIRLAEFEGDLIVPMSRDSLFLPNVRVTVALNAKTPRPVRFKTLKRRNFIVGHYQRHDTKSPYGNSPLMSGRPVQVAATDALNDLMAGARLNALPPVAYDSNDAHFSGGRGPELYPGAQYASDSPNSVEPIYIPNLNDMTNTYLALLKQFEDTTGVNDPRRGAAARSHTTATSADLENARGIARTDDFVADEEKGPITSMLYMEWQIIKEALTKQVPMPVNMGGIEGWVRLAAADLADNVAFTVEGSAGLANERERAALFATAVQQAVQMAQIARQEGKPFDLRFNEIVQEVFKNAGQHNTQRFVGNDEGEPGEIEEGPGVATGAGSAGSAGVATLPAQRAGVG